MSIPKETLWEMEPHTKAKHEILRHYLGAWFGIMGTKNPKIIYLDGFCGPGRYLGNEDGSPIIALKIAIDQSSKQRIKEAVFIFIEENESRFQHLEKEIKSLQIPANFILSPYFNKFENTLTTILDDLESQGAQLPPSFAFIDPFGFKGAPYKIIKRLLSNDKSEVFINIMVDSINRFLEHQNPQITQHIIDLFGTSEVIDIIQSNGDRVGQLRELYQKQLLKIAKFVRFFEMRDENNRTIYFLFFATNNRLGHLKMKEAFWQVDTIAGYTFSDETDPNQLVLFKEDPSLNLSNELAVHFSGKILSVEEIRIHIEDNSPYTKSHMKKALWNLEEQERLFVEHLKQNGTKRKGKTFPDDVIVNFPSIK